MGFRSREDFAFYTSKPLQLFELFRPRGGALGAVTEHWNRRRLRGNLPHGVMASAANVLPREWARTWQVCRAGDPERSAAVAEVVEAFSKRTHEAGGRCAIACYKRALQRLGVIGSAAVARGTPPLRYPDTEHFDAALEAVQDLAEKRIGAPWVTRIEPSG